MLKEWSAPKAADFSTQRISSRVAPGFERGADVTAGAFRVEVRAAGGQHDANQLDQLPR
jgi:hypothetical protein